MSADRDALVERMAEAIWITYTNSRVAKPTLRGIIWSDLTRWAEESRKIADVRALALDEALAALAIAEPAIREDEREACAAYVDSVDATKPTFLEDIAAAEETPHGS